MSNKKIVVTCSQCGQILLYDSGDQLTQQNADEYQANTSCDICGKEHIVATLSDEAP